MNESIDLDMQKKLQAAYNQGAKAGYKDGIERSCEFYSIAMREIHLRIYEKLISSVDQLFRDDLQPDEKDPPK